MSQIFSADAQVTTQDIVVPASLFADGPITNLLPVPLTNAKAKVLGVALVGAAHDAVICWVQLYRNPAQENLLLTTVQQVVAIDSNNVIAVAAIDPIPDNRSVQYVMRVIFPGTATDGNLWTGSYIEATLISG